MATYQQKFNEYFGDHPINARTYIAFIRLAEGDLTKSSYEVMRNATEDIYEKAYKALRLPQEYVKDKEA